MALNVEMSLSKARELLAREHGVSQAAMPINLPVARIDNEPPEAPNVLVDAVSLSGAAGNDGKHTKPLVRHVLVKDLNKIGDRLKMNLPKTGIFGKKAPVGLYALFDGQSCSGEPGPAAAEFCARNLHTKLLKRLTALQPDPSEFVVEGVLRETFDDLDQELLTARPEITDGCGAAVALLIGGHVITALLGRCGSMLCEAGPGGRCVPVQLGAGRGAAKTQQQSDQCLGEFWEYDQGQLSQCRYVSITPEVRSVALRDDSAHPCLVMTSSTISEVLNPQQLVDLAQDFPRQPRAACGEIVCRATEARAAAGRPAQCTAVAVGFLPTRENKDKRATSEPAAKRPKVQTPRGGGTHSMRLRHILIGFTDSPQAPEAAAAAAALPKKRGPSNPRTRQEAEALLRWAIGELRKDIKASKRPPKDAMELVNLTNKKFAELSKEYSECDTARQGGNTSGDLGWLTREERSNFGAGFKEVVDVLLPGHFSDIAASDRGLHLVQRLA